MKSVIYVHEDSTATKEQLEAEGFRFSDSKNCYVKVL